MIIFSDAKLIHQKVLDNSTQETVTLEDDLEVLKDYVALNCASIFLWNFKINVDENIAARTNLYSAFAYTTHS